MGSPRRTRDDSDRFFDYGIDTPTRTILLVGDIDDMSAESAVTSLHLLDRTAGEITIKLCSDGGEWYSGMGIYDAIMACNNEVRIVGLGKVMSMGTVILQAADYRVLAPNTTLLIHYGSDWFAGHTKDLERRAQESARTSIVMEDIFLAKIRDRLPEFTREQFKSKFAFDVFMSAQEAVDFGLADSILT